ncbi:MAG: hypothetical protein Q8873_00985 [Bacillota bacterium]|nr:hypothetical protein [Bacillota bacterium]
MAKIKKHTAAFVISILVVALVTAAAVIVLNINSNINLKKEIGHGKKQETVKDSRSSLQSGMQEIPKGRSPVSGSGKNAGDKASDSTKNTGGKTSGVTKNAGDKASGGSADTEKSYILQCKFQGMIDENSFEVTQLDYDTTKKALIEGKTLQLRIADDSVRSDIESLNAGDNIAIECSYNSYSQLVAKRIMLSSK